MLQDVEVPPPPTLEPVDADEDYRREDIADRLAEGAWAEAFDAWAAETALGPTGYGVVRDREMLEEFDFFWDDFVSRVGYHAPGLPEDWREREIHPDLDSWETVSTINAALADLGARTSTVLTEEYVDWGDSDPVGEDLPDFE